MDNAFVIKIPDELVLEINKFVESAPPALRQAIEKAITLPDGKPCPQAVQAIFAYAILSASRTC